MRFLGASAFFGMFALNYINAVGVVDPVVRQIEYYKRNAIYKHKRGFGPC